MAPKKITTTKLIPKSQIKRGKYLSKNNFPILCKYTILNL
jgi:hypothetical protein